MTSQFRQSCRRRRRCRHLKTFIWSHLRSTKKRSFANFGCFENDPDFEIGEQKISSTRKKISVVVTFSNHSFFWAGGGLARPGLDLWPPKEVISVRGRKYFRPKQKNKAAFINYVFSVERDSEGKYFISKIRSKTPESLFRCRRSFKFRNKQFFYQPRNSFDSNERTVFWQKTVTWTKLLPLTFFLQSAASSELWIIGTWRFVRLVSVAFDLLMCSVTTLKIGILVIGRFFFCSDWFFCEENDSRCVVSGFDHII